MSFWSVIAAIAFVDPFIGTDGTGHTTPAAWYPAGLVQPGPDSGYSSWEHCSGYCSKDATLCGFSQTHLSGTGCPDLADFLLQPFVGENPRVADPAPKFEHSLVLRAPKLEGSERATPGYYTVTYADSRIRTEITAGPRTAIYRFTAGKGGFKFLVDGQWNNARSKGWIHRTVLDSEMSVGTDSRTISGRVHKKCWLERNVWFKAAFDRPFRSAERLPRSASDRADRWVLDFALEEGETLLVKVSISASSADGVERNLAEVADWDFDAMRRRAEARWEELLGAVELPGCDDERRTVFYTALYHAYLQPVRLSDAGEREFYSAFSIWDTFRAVHPLYTILRPETTAPFVNSFLEHYRHEGSLPVMPYFGYDSDCMLGKHTVPVIVDAYLKGVTGVDWDLAYEAVTNALTVTHPQAEKEDWAVYGEKGYYPFDVVGGEGVSRTMEIAYDDWCAARFARARGDAKTADFFFRRAGNWTNVLDRSLGLVRGRDSSGAWRTPFDPFRFGGGKDWLPYDCTEGNAWQYTWHVMQDVPGLVAAHGGERELARRVEKLFSLSHPKAPEEPSDCTGQIGEYVHGNEPSHHILYLLPQLHDGNFAAEKIREVCDRFYHGGTDGLCGNDDCGQMSAWYVFSAMGFYPFDPCGGEFVLGAPQVPRVEIEVERRGGGGQRKKFVVVADGLSKENKYVKSVTLNGKALKEPKISYADIMRGGELRFKMWNLRTVTPAARPPDAFTVKYDAKSGGVASLVFDGDAAKMNWVEGSAQWGLPSFAPVPGNEVRFRGAVESNGTFTAVWSGESLELTAERRAEANVLHETYVFRNISTHPVYVKRGDLGVFTTFNDSYDGAATCLSGRCHTHLWCRGEGSYVRALKMGTYPHGLALVLTQGALDSYSVTRFRHKESNDRGDFTLHPEPFKLEEGESYTLAWDVVAYADGNFRERLLGYPNACAISFENETVFQDERFRLTAECGEPVKTATAELNGRTVPCKVDGRTVRIEVCPDFLGEANFVLTVNGRRYFARGWVAEPVATLIPKRIRKIIEQNQCRDKSSRLYGAYLIYDNEEERQFFNWRRRDWNASRERVGMALLLARWARRHPSAEIRASLKLYEDFLLREIVDAATGAVSDTIGHDDSRVRHYNAPWYVNFWWEMHALTGEARYLDLVEKGIVDYFAKAGPDFYPIACNFAECVDTLARAGRDVTGLKRLLRTQADSMIARGDRSPSQEVNYEQTLVTPPTTVLSGYCRFIERDPAALLCVSNHIRTLCRFQGDQPDHRLNDISIRHWDEYWFGKRELYGDAFPHYWSCLTSHDFVLFADLTGDESFRRRAEKGFRNLLCLFRPDGTATCAHAYPFSVTMLKTDGTPEGPRIRGEFDDPWANDQDYGLYVALKDCFE